MATGGGGSFADDFVGVGHESDGGGRSWGGGDPRVGANGDDLFSANTDGAEQPVLLLAPPPPLPESQQAWTAGGRHSCNDPMSHYLYNGNG
jgi:hypothetical protein